MIEITFRHENPGQIKAEMLDFLGIKLVDRAPAPATAAEPAAEAGPTGPVAEAPAGKTRGRKPAAKPEAASAAELQVPAVPTYVLDQGGTKIECTAENIEETFQETVNAIENLTDLKSLSARNKAMIVSLGEVNEPLAQALLDIYQARRAALAEDAKPAPAPQPADDVPTLDVAQQALVTMSAVPGLGVTAALELLAEYKAKLVKDIPDDKRADFIAACKRLKDAKEAEG